METVLITGGTGTIGSALAKLLLSKDYKVIVVSRKKKSGEGGIVYKTWHPEKLEIDREAIVDTDHIIHLAGAGVGDKRWTKKRKREIVASRVNSSETIVKALRELPNKVKTVVSASGIGWYGPDKINQKPFVESNPAFPDFLGNTCVQWENSIKPVQELGKRLVILRTGIVLSNEGGAFVEFVKPLRGGIAAILGSGSQMISWIHIDDICRAYVAAIENGFMQGVYNACAPEVVTNKEFMMKLARMRQRPFIPIHVPEFVLKIVLGEMSVEILKSATVDDSKLRGSGFQFLCPGIEAAIGELVGGKSKIKN